MRLDEEGGSREGRMGRGKKGNSTRFFPEKHQKGENLCRPGGRKENYEKPGRRKERRKGARRGEGSFQAEKEKEGVI